MHWPVNKYHPVTDDVTFAEHFDVHLDNNEGWPVGKERRDDGVVVRALSEKLATLRKHLPKPQLPKDLIEVDEPMVEPADADAESEGDSGDSSDDSELPASSQMRKRNIPNYARDIVWLSGGGGDEGDLHT
jgi:hypothetical protein